MSGNRLTGTLPPSWGELNNSVSITVMSYSDYLAYLLGSMLCVSLLACDGQGNQATKHTVCHAIYSRKVQQSSLISDQVGVMLSVHAALLQVKDSIAKQALTFFQCRVSNQACLANHLVASH